MGCWGDGGMERGGGYLIAGRGGRLVSYMMMIFFAVVMYLIR